MGQLLKPRFFTKSQAEERLAADIAEARGRYDRRLKEIEDRDADLRRQAEMGEPKLPTRAANCLRHLLATVESHTAFGRPIYTYPKTIDPKDASKLSASVILKEPNSGHKTVSDIALWLRFHGYELQP